MTIDVKGELSEEEIEAMNEFQSAKIKFQERSKQLDVLEILSPPSITKEECKENKEAYIRKSNSLFKNSIISRKCLIKLIFLFFLNFFR